MLNAVAKVFAPARTRVPPSPLAMAWVVEVSRTPVKVRVLPGTTRISLPALSVRMLRAVVMFSVARRWPPCRLMTLPALPVIVVPLGIAVAMLTLMVKLTPGLNAVIVAPAGTFVPKTGMPTYQPAVLPV